jgi:hypothetical protein
MHILYSITNLHCATTIETMAGGDRSRLRPKETGDYTERLSLFGEIAGTAETRRHKK